MSQKLKLFVWEDVLTEYTDGIMFALAKDEKQAMELIRKKHPYIEDEHFTVEVREVKSKEGFLVHGGT